MKIGSKLAILLLIIVAFMHALRVIYGINVTVENWVVPQWVSLFGIIGPGIITLLLWKERS